MSKTHQLSFTAEHVDELLDKVDKGTVYQDATADNHGLMSATDKTKLDALPTAQQIDGALNDKVDKETGKGLSKNDYTDADKAKVASALQTETDPTVPSWAKQSNKPSYDYSEIGNTPDLSGFITKSVDDLANYYLKSETYTKAEVAALIGAIQQFHYEIYATLPQSGASDVLYLVGPTGSGSDRYEEYVYANNAWTKIGDTSIDLSGYVTTSALDTALADYTTTANLTDLLAGKQDTINDLEDIRSGSALGATSVQEISIGTTTTGAAGTDASVTNSGTSTNPVLNFTIPKGADAVNPFKGWYPSEASLPSDPAVGDFAYVKGATASDPTAIYECTTEGSWSDSGRTVDTSNVQTFETGEHVNQTRIDDTNLVNPGSNALTKATDVMQLKAKLNGVTASEVKVNAVIGTNVTTGAYVSGETGLLVTPGSSASSYAYFELAIPQGTKSIRFATGTKTSSAKIGYSFGHYEENVYVPTRKFYFDVASTTPPTGIVEKVIEVLEGETTFMVTVAAVSTYASITLDAFYCYLQSGDSVSEMIGKNKVQVVDNLDTDDATKALSAKQGKVLSDTIFGEVVIEEEEVDFDVVSTKTGQLLANYIHGSSDSTIGKIYVVPVHAGETLQIQAQAGIGVYLCILNTNPTIPSGGIPAQDIPVATNCEGYVTSGAGNYRMVIVAGSSATIKILANSDAKYVYIQKLFHSSTEPLTPQSFVIQKEKREGGIIEESKVDAGFYLTIEHGDIDGNGKIIPDDNKAVTNFINNGNGFYIELENGFYVERAVLYDKSGNLVTYNYYVHSTSGHASTDNNCWGNNEQLPQFLVRLVLKSESDINVPLNNIVKRFVYLNDNRLTKVLPQNLDYAKFMYKLHQLTNVIWVPAEKAQHNYGGDGINNVLWFLKGTIVTGVPYSTETEYSKFIGIDVALRTFLSAAKNKRSVIYTECVEQGHARSAYGLSYHGEANYTGNFYGSVCTGLTSYLLGYNVNEYVGSMDTRLGNANKFAHGKETLYWGDNVVTIDDLVQQLQPMDIILNSSHISVISDVYKDEYGVVQYVVWTEQTGPTARMIPYSKDMLAKRFANKEFSIYRLPSETWADALAKNVENTKDIIQSSFFDFEPKDVEIDPDISTFEGEYAVFVDNADNDNTDSYNNYKAFLNIHRGGVYTSLQIFGEDEDASTATPVEVNISANSGTFIYNSSIYADDSMDKDDWIVVDLMQLSPKLAAGKYKARVVGSNIESGFTHFQIVSISMTPTWNGNNVTRLDFNVDGGDVVSVSQQNNIRSIRINDISASEQEQGYVTFSGDGWNASNYYIKLVVRTDYGTAVKRINKSSYSS